MEKNVLSQAAQHRRLIKDPPQSPENPAGGRGYDIMRDGADEAKPIAFSARLNHRSISLFISEWTGRRVFGNEMGRLGLFALFGVAAGIANPLERFIREQPDIRG